MPTAPKPRLGEWLLLAGSACVAFFAAEAFCRLALPRPGFLPLTGDTLPGAIQSHPTRLYELVPNFSALITGGAFKTMRVETNAIGLRERALERLQSSKLRILAVGDSFTFGVGIDREQAWPAQLERALLQRFPALSVSVINAGVPGYGLAQIRDLSEELITKLTPQLVIVGVYAGGFYRLIDPYTAMGDRVVQKSQIERLREVEGGFIHSDVTPALVSFDLWLKTHWYAGAYCFNGAYKLLRAFRNVLMFGDHSSEKQHEIGMEEIERIRKYASDRGISFAVLLVISFDTNNRPDEDEQASRMAVKRFCSESGIMIVDPTLILVHSGERLRVNGEDNHWSASANALVAQELASYALSLMPQDP